MGKFDFIDHQIRCYCIICKHLNYKMLSLMIPAGNKVSDIEEKIRNACSAMILSFNKLLN